jgi:DNA-binding MarR family transcriptional regulator
MGQTRAVPKPSRLSPPEPKVPSTSSRVSFKIHRVNAKIAMVCNRLFRAREIDLISSRILVFLLEAEEMRVGQLVDIMVLPQSTISHQLRNLDRRGLIRRTRAEDDNRSVTVTLTEEGRRVAQECNDLSRDVYLHMIHGLSEAELGQLSGLLDRLFATLDDFEPSEI